MCIECGSNVFIGMKIVAFEYSTAGCVPFYT